MRRTLFALPSRAPLKALVGSEDRIGLTILPFLATGLVLNLAYPALFDVGGPPVALVVVSGSVLTAGVVIWAWSVALILTCVPKGQLITVGPYAVMKHPLYTAVALLVLPWVGFLLDTWLGAALGLVVYVASRIFAPAEERELSRVFGSALARYQSRVKLPWL